GGVHNGNRWVHVGTHETYIALNEGAQRAKSDAYETSGINHLGYVVDDAEAVKQRLLKAGFKEGFVPPEHPHRRRVYLFDSDGFEWEFVQYYSENLAERNDYTQ
ncbi:MAG: VOC family protein, partial [Planctomycetota bacterium]|nr:VOC family protein [Planctomycetota bacterium]